MAFLDDLGKVVTKTSQDVAKKAKDMAEKGNIKLQLKEEKWRLHEAYAQLGEKYHEIYGENAPEEVKEMAEAVETLKRKITILEEQRAKIKAEKSCSNCGTKMVAKGNFCTACGEAYPEETEEAEEVSFHDCRGCGAQVMEEESFCAKCGVKQEDKKEVPKDEEVVEEVEPKAAEETKETKK